MRRIVLVTACLVISVMGFAMTDALAAKKDIPAPVAPALTNPEIKEYESFFEEVYATMEKNYYYLIPRPAYEKFLFIFENKIYRQMKKAGKTSQYIKWRSAAHMVEFLKANEDVFSAFIPPKPAKEFEQTALGKRTDLGITGNLTENGYQVSHVEPRSDAYEKGLREKDIIIEIDKVAVGTLTGEKINELLTPLDGATVNLTYVDVRNRALNSIDVLTKEYFKQTVFMCPVDVPGVFCLEIRKFNRTTADDLTRFMDFILKQGPSSLIIDLRGNPGGPPLAAREISAFFLPPYQEFTYFKMRNQPKASLFVPAIPTRFHYQGDIVILVNKESGSASELFSGVLQSRGRATIMGANTAGQVFLKSMYNFADESMLLLVTARGHLPDGRVFSFDGVEPDQKVTGEADLVKLAAEYLKAAKP
jgi:C-terminal peptidase prc